jgi:SAM-dependent methyltransferase
MGSVLAARAPQAEVVAAKAERLPLRDGFAAGLVGASMWHWVDEERGAAEVARVLQPGGRFGLLWSGPDRSVDWVAELLHRPDSWSDQDRRDGAHVRRRHDVHLPSGAPFGPPELRTISFTLALTPDELVGLAGTYSGIITLPAVDRQARRERLEALVRDHEVLGGQPRVDLPMRCHCWRTSRRR